ncbi:hypothetical protein TGPRC2_423490 [Toxoplasma gondii TgCatPRC2]|uniref:Uncharacterized protein n=1 Tax=Toxoplasma gondii TgCatPRC2 TaxID=1130821 RepID=A0A151HNA9_TOXGO|nr:hypothetical protein TGPRC2_423490 [Toxoplasma gondii TgCatPRC2]
MVTSIQRAIFTLICDYLRQGLPPPQQHDIRPVIRSFVCGSGPLVNGAVVNLHPEVRCRRLEKHVPVEENSARVREEWKGRVWGGEFMSVCAHGCCRCKGSEAVAGNWAVADESVIMLLASAGDKFVARCRKLLFSLRAL